MKLLRILPFILLLSCGQEPKPEIAAEKPAPPLKTIGKVEKMSPELDSIIAPDAKIEVLADSFTWAEGPVWLDRYDMLLFTDVPENKIYKWKEGQGVSLYLTPSGFTGEKTTSPEPGANGLAVNAKGMLAVCQHGDRRVGRVSGDLLNPDHHFDVLADKWNGKRFNSPNDLCFDPMSRLYFTDPPYGLKDHEKSADKEIPFQGVYLRNLQTEVILLDSTLKFPNGIAITPDAKKLFVSNSDPDNAIWKVYDINLDGTVKNGKTFKDVTPMVKEGLKGLPDGLKISSKGIIFATGPGGVLIFKMDGTLLGRINPGEPTANCAFGGDGYLYMTSDMYLCRIRLLK